MSKLGWLALGAVLSCSGAAFAQPPMRSLDRCMAITDPAARLSCYDNTLARPAPAPEPSAAPRASAAPGAPIAANDRPAAPARYTPPKPPSPPSIIDGQIAAIVPIGDDLFRFRLSDGSVWRTGEQPLVRPQLGETVRIRRSVLAYFATIGGRAAIGVRPVR